MQMKKFDLTQWSLYAYVWLRFDYCVLHALRIPPHLPITVVRLTLSTASDFRDVFLDPRM